MPLPNADAKAHTISHLRDAIASLDAQMALLQAQKRELQARLDQEVRMQSPVHRLPSELLSSIFVLSVLGEGLAAEENPVVLGTIMLVWCVTFAAFISISGLTHSQPTVERSCPELPQTLVESEHQRARLPHQGQTTVGEIAILATGHQHQFRATRRVHDHHHHHPSCRPIQRSLVGLWQFIDLGLRLYQPSHRKWLRNPYPQQRANDQDDYDTRERDGFDYPLNGTLQARSVAHPIFHTARSQQAASPRGPDAVQGLPCTHARASHHPHLSQPP